MIFMCNLTDFMCPFYCIPIDGYCTGIIKYGGCIKSIPSFYKTGEYWGKGCGSSPGDCSNSSGSTFSPKYIISISWSFSFSGSCGVPVGLRHRDGGIHSV